MKIATTLIVLSFLIFAATPSGLAQNDVDMIKKTYTEITVDGKTMLFGLGDRTAFNLPNYKHWFDSTYQAYTLNTGMLDEVKDANEELNIEIYLGTWCSDSRREVPALYKIMDYLDISEENVHLVFVDRSKGEPAEYLKGNEIEYVPTIKVFMRGSEIGSIVEFPHATLEKDLHNMVFAN